MPPSALVIDDDVDIQLLGKMLLSRHGFEVATAGCLGELARKPALLNTNLIVLDFGLGDFTGLDILDYLYDLKINAPILLLSSCNNETAAHAIAKGTSKGLKMLGFLPKARLMTGLSDFIKQIESSPKPPTVGELAQAIKQQHICLAFQPKVSLMTGTVLGVEALVRWEDPARGTIYPDNFIPLAERSGLMVPLTWCILELALAQLSAWHTRGLPLSIAINVPAEFVKAENMLSMFDELCAKHTIDMTKVTLELTESVGVECLGYARHILEELRKRGCKLALDDFGTGYSSLTQLYRLPFDELKIDRSFVSLIDSEPSAQAITLSIVELGARLGMSVVAEGIENADQHAILAKAHCPIGQGYFISRPLSAAVFDEWLQHQMTMAKRA
ncbi:EAL domain-containing response regulator [Vreelandella lionensis]|uniref:EAL domain-containing response regulator n=1 Tax=Vreelandella lionensis TaxID=1144478 RepID=UPI0009F68EB1|nr:EAL domain-containing response regulator [Halomonas lionensis]